ncbi:MAG TPA: MBL fold metallo-hydrolase [Terracidiphilus sp.]|jgi:beta-lactamase superfamily II metal-dependent hydrolase
MRRAAFPRILCLSISLSLVCAASVATAAAQRAPRKNIDLLIYAIDVEGGQSTLVVSPSGGSLLIDTGWAGNNGRDAERIMEAMKDAGISKIDKVLITHFHTDHVGGVPELVKRVKVGEFLDHGVNREDSDITRKDFAAYVAAIGNTPRHTLHPGDVIDIPGLNTAVLTADGEHVNSVPGIKPKANPYCASEPRWQLDQSENPRSVGILIRFGLFSFLDLGDLTKPKEVDLVCPNNPIGAVSVYLVSHHGLDQSSSKSLVDSIHPRAAIMDNGAHKGGSPEAWQTVNEAVGSQNLFMLHNAEGSDAAHNSPEALIANPKGDGHGHYLTIVADGDGSFSVTNSRTGQSKHYDHE